MNIQELLNTLIERSSVNTTSITLSMKTHRLNNDAEQDPVRFKNLTNEIEQKLKDGEWTEDEIKSLREKFENLSNKHRFWLEQNDSLLVYADKEFFTHIKLPAEAPSGTYVEDHFYIKPLLRLQTYNAPFFVLAISKNDNRLLKADRLTFETINLEDVPDSYDAFTELDVFETSQDAQGGATKGNFHGKGDAAEDKYQLLKKYIKQIEKAVTPELRKFDYPLILAGVDNIVAEYKKLNKYAHLYDEAYIKGNPDRKTDQTLHEEAWAIAEEAITQKISGIVEESADLSNTERFVHSINDIVKAAYYGQIDRLFIKSNANWPGSYNIDTEAVEIRNDAEADLSNVAALQCIKNSGEVYVLENGLMPKNTDISAVLRYPVSA